MATNFYVEYKEIKADEKTIVEKIKTLWKEQGNRVKDMKKIDIYFKAEEGVCYYFVNDSDSGNFSIENL